MAVEVESGAYIYQGDEVFSHNPLHDLESPWWVSIWFLLCHYDPSKLRDTTVQQHIKVVKRLRETVFNNRLHPNSRRLALTGSAPVLIHSKPGFFPKAVQRLILLLDMFREQLVTHYKLYKPMASPPFFISDLHHKFGNKFKKPMKE